MSASPELADVVKPACQVRKVPTSDDWMLMSVENVLPFGSFDLLRQDYHAASKQPFQY
jgi:hypothetical protein